ncbi:MAG: polyphosphate kinase [Gammaproteobacteria bacterium]|nr:polyphosphate kinase [Gammaproteobacteria bacterium]|tara:strand:+ start:473 stop:1303 length:831 start_codon:yes stop_codon:yes gene_type:complete
MKIFNVKQYDKLSKLAYQDEVKRLQVEFLKLQEWVIDEKKKLAFVFEGRDAAGKTGVINVMKENLIPKHIRYIKLGVPDRSASKHWFQSYQDQMPKEGEIVFFDRSWYTRATVEITMGYCKHNQYRKFMNKVNGWERKLNKKGIELKKLYLSVSQSEQDKRFKARQNDPLKYWKLTKHDLSMAKKWDIYSFFKTKMFERTSTGLFPWVIINADNKMIARLSALRFILNEFNYPKKKLRVSSDWTSKINNYQFTFRGVGFEDLSYEQHSLLSKYLSE